MQARNLAKNIYDDVKEILPGMGPTNPQHMALGIAQLDLSVNIHTAIRQHFGRLPVLVTKKMESVGTVDIPQLDYTTHSSEADKEDEEEEQDPEKDMLDDSKLNFKEGRGGDTSKSYRL
ncbi:hypothetical protein BGZ65_000109, partial [Modicella reniformis]